MGNPGGTPALVGGQGSILEHPLRGGAQWQLVILVWVGPEGLGQWERGGEGHCHRAGSWWSGKRNSYLGRAHELQTNKQTNKSKNHRTGENSTSLVSCAVTPKTAPLVCNSQYSGTGRGNPVRKGGRQEPVKFWRQLKVSWGPGALALGLGACVRGSG